ncbi:MAG: hypothetical protein K9J03_03740 [Candidatus Methylopumilus sp.]|nr:hypothetical protein [Candidatus Methylopumilus sp.]
MKLSASKLTLTISTSLLLTLASSQAFASPRLCGYIAVDNPNKMGILAEFSDNDSLYHKKCDQALDDSWKKIQSNAQLQALNWRKITRNKCYDVAKQGFLNDGDNADLLCNNMDSDNGYKITKKGSAGATFEKQPGSNPGGVGGVANDIDNGVNQGTKAIKKLF